MDLSFSDTCFTFPECQIFSCEEDSKLDEKTSKRCLLFHANKKLSRNNLNPALLKKTRNLKKPVAFSGRFKNCACDTIFRRCFHHMKSFLNFDETWFPSKTTSKECVYTFFSTCDRQQKKAPPICKRLNFWEFHIFSQIGNTWKTFPFWKSFLFFKTLKTQVTLPKRGPGCVV